jgi:hypothetical protein
MQLRRLAVDQEQLDHLTRQFDELVRERLPDAPIAKAEVLQYGDDPEIEPGQLMGRVTIEVGNTEEERKRDFRAFHDGQRDAIHELRKELDRIPEAQLLEFVASGEAEDGEHRGPRIRLAGSRGSLEVAGVSLTPVMARLGPDDLETVDALITAGIAASRAEAVRWALARIRERPAYAQLRDRAREIEELKAQF